MPWAKKQNHEGCPSDKPWAVVNDDTDEVKGCHATEEDADAQLAALNANAPEEEEATTGGQVALAEEVADPIIEVESPDGDGDSMAFNMPVMVIEGAWTGDNRYIDPGVLTWRALPLPVMAITKTTMGHDDAELSARMDDVQRGDANEAGLLDPRTGEAYAEGTTFLSSSGQFDSSEWATEIKRLVGDGFLRGVSVDLSDVTSDIVFLDSDGNEVDDVDFWDILFGEADEDYDIGEKIRAGRVMGVTICPFPAFEGAYVEIPLVAGGFMVTPSYDSITQERWPSVFNLDKPGMRPVTALVAGGAPVQPPAKWFENPQFTVKTPLTIDADGHIYGHMASWDECHSAFSGQCIVAPRSATDYAYYRLASVLCDDGETLVATGRITMNTGHAELWMDATQARAHYDNTGTAVADVVSGEDEFGIWYSGALLPDVDELAIRRLRGSVLSGDWRDRGGNLELIACLAVNTPGYAIRRPVVRVASGWPQAMVAAGIVTPVNARRPNKSVTASAGHRVVDDAYKDEVVRESLRNRVHNN